VLELARLMVDLETSMNEPKFVRWTISGSDGTPSWTDARSTASSSRLRIVAMSFLPDR